MATLKSVLPDKVNILIVDDEALPREGLRALLQNEAFVGKIYDAEDEQTFMSRLKSSKIDIVLLDIKLEKTSGLELLRKMEAMRRHPYVIAVTGLCGEELIVELLNFGVNGIVLKPEGYAETRKAIKGVFDSVYYFSKRVLKVIRNYSDRWGDIPPVFLTPQEKELLKAIATGVTSKEIASLLKRSTGATETFRIRLMRKVGVSNTAALLVYAFRNGIL